MPNSLIECLESLVEAIYIIPHLECTPKELAKHMPKPKPKDEDFSFGYTGFKAWSGSSSTSSGPAFTYAISTPIVGPANTYTINTPTHGTITITTGTSSGPSYKDMEEAYTKAMTMETLNEITKAEIMPILIKEDLFGGSNPMLGYFRSNATITGLNEL